ncbi:hydantoinase B/oxoprolinase family protein [Ottowia thiooxydans]|uniref:N-methylhydantoinase B n=1 Tax=Ottowia thiooxydans TaxID=219182 RepID=A0ABV2QC34_9BURK
MKIDPVSLEVIRNGLTAIAEEMSSVVMRAARSPLLREAGDHSSALTDSHGYLVAQGKDVPVHLGVLSFTVKEFLKHVGLDALRPGDVWILNLPEIGGNHLPDVKLIRPVFDDTELYAFAVSLAHWADIGGAAPGSYYAAATDSWQEGLRIPPVRLVSGDAIDEEKMLFIMSNVRGAEERRGDVLAQISATTVAARRLGELVKAHGTPFLKASFNAIHDRAERQMRDAIRAVPNGVYQGEDYLDDDGHAGDPVPVRVSITIEDETAIFDFSESGDAVPGPLNTTPVIASAGVFYVMKSLFGADIQPSAGCYRPIQVITRPGSLFQPEQMLPVVGGNHETSQRVCDAVFRAFEPIAAPLLTAGGPTTAGLLIFSAKKADGSWATFYEVHGGGEGARADRDGMSAIRCHLANVMNTPAEVVESEYPFLIEVQGIRRGSGGRGQFRGGDGLLRHYRMLQDQVSLTTMYERAVIPPYGLQGGEPGATFRVTLERANGSIEPLRGKQNVIVNRGDLVKVETCGGGGYGQATA